MADYAISNVPRRVVYAASGTGPYAFTFEILNQTDIAVYKASTLLTLTTDYTVTINANGTGSVTLVTSAGTSNITIVGAKNIQRTTDFTTGGDLFANTLNDELDNQTIFIQQVAETAERGLKAPVVDPTDINMTLPAKASRVGTVLAFNATTGNPEAGPSIGSVATVAAQSANINTVATNIGSVNTVAGNITNVNTVAGVSSNVTAVATNIANVNAVGADLLEGTSEINTVAVDIANVNTVGTNIASVNTVAGEIGAGQDVTVVAANLSGTNTIGTVATNIANVNATGTNIANVNAVGADLLEPVSEINTVATDITNVNTVGTNIGSVNTVAGISGAVSTVSGIAANVTTVAGVSSNVTTVAGISSNVTTVAGISGNVTSVAGNATNINAVAGNATNINAVNANKTNIDTVAGISANVTTVANNSANVTIAATNVADINNFADVYQGAKATDPTLRNDGSALQSGDLYFNTTDDVMKVREAGAWLAAYASLSGALIAANNLSDLTSASTARTNIGLGTGNNVQFTNLTYTGTLTGSTDVINIGSGQFYKNAGGDIGIGTSTPPTGTGVRSITVNASDYPAYYLSQSGTLVGGVFGYYDSVHLSAIGARHLQFNTNSAERMRITSAGDVGIGTSSPSNAKLHIFGDWVGGSSTVKVQPITSFASGGQAGYGTYDSNGTRIAVLYSYVSGTVLGTSTSAPLSFETNGVERMRIDASGNIGVSTSSPARLFDISKSSNSGNSSTFPTLMVRNTLGTQGNASTTFNFARIDVQSGNGVVFGDVGTRYDAGFDGMYLGTESSHPLYFQTTGSERIRITSSGYTKISNDGTYINSTGSFHEIKQTGTSNAVIIWNSSSSATTDGIVRIDANRNTTDNTFYALTYYNAGAGAYKFRVADSGAIATAGSIALGASTAPTSGIGIQFPATQSASSNANTLDDYEEGTWTPSFTGFTAVGAVTSSGHYVKIGRVVYLTATYSAATSFSCGTGGASYIGSLPFTSTSGVQGQSAVVVGDGAASTAYPSNVFAYDNMYPPNISHGANRSATFSVVYIATN